MLYIIPFSNKNNPLLNVNHRFTNLLLLCIFIKPNTIQNVKISMATACTTDCKMHSNHTMYLLVHGPLTSKQSLPLNSGNIQNKGYAPVALLI